MAKADKIVPGTIPPDMREPPPEIGLARVSKHARGRQRAEDKRYAKLRRKASKAARKSRRHNRGG